MKVKELIAALQQCHPESEIDFCLDLQSDEGRLIAVEYEVRWMIDRGDKNPIGRVHLLNDKSHIVDAGDDQFLIT
jgi:hypothetical protein